MTYEALLQSIIGATDKRAALRTLETLCLTGSSRIVIRPDVLELRAFWPRFHGWCNPMLP